MTDFSWFINGLCFIALFLAYEVRVALAEATTELLRALARIFREAALPRGRQ